MASRIITNLGWNSEWWVYPTRKWGSFVFPRLSSWITHVDVFHISTALTCFMSNSTHHISRVTLQRLIHSRQYLLRKRAYKYLRLSSIILIYFLGFTIRFFTTLFRTTNFRIISNCLQLNLFTTMNHILIADNLHYFDHVILDISINRVATT